MTQEYGTGCRHPLAASMTRPSRRERPVDSVQFLAAAKTAGRPLLVAQTARFQPVHLDIARAVAEGAIGMPRLAHLTWYTGHVWPGGWRGWQLDASRSGGHVAHNGVHALDLLTWLMDDEPVRVFARPCRTWASGMPTPDSSTRTLPRSPCAVRTASASPARSAGPPGRRRCGCVHRVLRRHPLRAHSAGDGGRYSRGRRGGRGRTLLSTRGRCPCRPRRPRDCHGRGLTGVRAHAYVRTSIADTGPDMGVFSSAPRVAARTRRIYTTHSSSKVVPGELRPAEGRSSPSVRWARPASC